MLNANDTAWSLCANCGTTDPDRDIENNLCAACFASMPEESWSTAGSWTPDPEMVGDSRD